MSEPTLRDVLAEVKATRQDIQALEARLESEVKRWDERFFQSSRDTLNFTRNVVVIAAVTAVLIPLLRDVTPLIIDIMKETSR
ncbi:hypothetical protein [Thermostichus vulcanus]|uniref:Uncharacterized protein n=1 Tax=Thermostichus vulcanus str. 'Rupite' TaxID=2813851 RepID=A0ABT0CAW2_THEVL|nr:hypothetical protein [Thermostichus vulcanus]MCJ2542847.1 hypothetical protein [Thermostichus vulcanus str. 'Rupite']